VIAEVSEGIVVMKEEGDLLEIVQRSHPGTPQAGTWVVIEPGWEVVAGGDLRTMAISHNNFRIH
jgi:hypothetical protein